MYYNLKILFILNKNDIVKQQKRTLLRFSFKKNYSLQLGYCKYVLRKGGTMGYIRTPDFLFFKKLYNSVFIYFQW